MLELLNEVDEISRETQEVQEGMPCDAFYVAPCYCFWDPVPPSTEK